MPSRRYRPAELDAIAARRLEVAVRQGVTAMRGEVLDIGCGNMPYRQLALSQPGVTGYVGVDLPGPLYGRPHAWWDGLDLPFRTGRFDAVLLTEVLEHCPDPGVVLAEARRSLREGGKLFLTVPFLWPLHDVPHDEYRYTPFALERLLGAAGFGSVDVRPLGGWDAAMAQMLGLWVRRRLSGKKRAVASALAAPIVGLLDRHDRAPATYTNSTMVTGLTVTATAGG